MNALVIDCNITVNWFHPPLEAAARAYSDGVLRDVIEQGLTLLVPQHWDIEVAAVLLRIQRNRAHGYGTEWLDQAMDRLSSLDIQTTQTLHYFAQVMDVAKVLNLSGYDTPYIHIAGSLRLPLATLDRAIIGACERFDVVHYQPSSTLA